jgi:hypothetical protein
VNGDHRLRATSWWMTGAKDIGAMTWRFDPNHLGTSIFLQCSGLRD